MLCHRDIIQVTNIVSRSFRYRFVKQHTCTAVTTVLPSHSISYFFLRISNKYLHIALYSQLLRLSALGTTSTYVLHPHRRRPPSTHSAGDIYPQHVLVGIILTISHAVTYSSEHDLGRPESASVARVIFLSDVEFCSGVPMKLD